MMKRYLLALLLLLPVLGFQGCLYLYVPYSDPMVAAEKGHQDSLVYHFKRKKVDPNSRDYLGQTPLIHAAKAGRMNAMTLLTDLGADINAQDQQGRTALMAAAAYGHETVLNYLLNHKADPNLTRQDGWTALMFAEQYGHSHCASILENSGARLPETPIAPMPGAMLLQSAETGRLAGIQTALEQGADINVRYVNTGETPLMEAAQNGHREIVAFLLEKKADPTIVDLTGMNAAKKAIAAGYPAIAESIPATAPKE